MWRERMTRFDILLRFSMTRRPRRRFIPLNKEGYRASYLEPPGGGAPNALASNYSGSSLLSPPRLKSSVLLMPFVGCHHTDGHRACDTVMLPFVSHERFSFMGRLIHFGLFSICVLIAFLSEIDISSLEAPPNMR